MIKGQGTEAMMGMMAEWWIGTRLDQGDGEVVP